MNEIRQMKVFFLIIFLYIYTKVTVIRIRPGFDDM